MQKAAMASSWHMPRVLMFLLVGVLVFVSASAARQNRKGALWIAESSGILNISTDSGELRFELPHALGVSSVAVNDINGDLWAYGKKRLYHYTREGQPLLDVDVPPSTHGGDPVDITVDGVSGNLWLAIQRDLYRFDLQGQLQQTLTLPREVIALGLDRFRSQLWVAIAQELRIYDMDGVLIRTVVLGQEDNISDLAYDRVSDQIWLNLSDRLRRYGHTGNALFETAGNFTGTISPDGARGLWLARDHELIHLDESGTQQFRTEPFAGEPDKHIVDLVADPQDASVWVASQRRIRHYAIDGELLNELTPELGVGVIRRLHRASLYADLDPPEIEITAPANASLLNNNRPTFELRYFDLGVGVDPDTIKIAVHGQPIAVSCSAGLSSANCTPNSALSEGLLQISATVDDFAGNVSDPDEIGITIDTTPPEITVTHPSQDYITNQPALTIRGSLNEPGTLTVNNSAVSLSSSFGFTYNTQLVEGSSVFELAAADRAGNRSNKTLRVILDTVPPAIPVSGLVTVSEPENGQATVIGQPGSVEPQARIVVKNLRTGETVLVVSDADGSFRVTLRADSGDGLSVHVEDAATNSSSPISAQVPGGLSLKITDPLNGSTSSAGAVLVTGELRGPPNTGVTVNGVVAEIVPDATGSRFFANIPLTAGTNTLTATAHQANGATRSQSVTVNWSGFQPFLVAVTPDSGVAPQEVSFSVAETSARQVKQIQIDFDGNGTFDFSAASAQTDIEHTYAAAGVYSAQIKILDTFNTNHQLAVTVIVLDPAQLDRAIQSVWADFNSVLLAGNKDQALLAFSPGSRDTYAEVFEALSSRMPEIGNEFSGVQPVTIANNHAAYAVLNVHNGIAKVFIINFIRDADGVWRIDSM